MPKLKEPRHELFAMYCAHGNYKKTAYELAGFKPKTDLSAKSAGSRLALKPEVKARIEELFAEKCRQEQERAVKYSQKYTVDRYVNDQLELATMAKARGNLEAAGTAFARVANAVGILKSVDGHQGDVHFHFTNELSRDDVNYDDGLKGDDEV